MKLVGEGVATFILASSNCSTYWHLQFGSPQSPHKLLSLSEERIGPWGTFNRCFQSKGGLGFFTYIQ